MEQALEETLKAILEQERENLGRLLAEIAEQDRETWAVLEEMLEQEREKWGRLLAEMAERDKEILAALAAMNLGQGT